MPEIALPANGWTPRRHQRALWRYLERGGKRAICVWHRRAGKDDVGLHWTACAHAMRVGTYWHMLPEGEQGRKAIWEAVNPHTGKRRIDEAFPMALRDTTRNNEMFIRFRNGATWQVVGSDNYDRLVGSPPIGIVASEWALANPAAWAYLRPILRENGGWVIFISTPRGRNHLQTMYDAAKRDGSWLAEVLPATATDVFSADDLDREREEYIREFGPDDGAARFRQEYLCDFNAAVIGSYYGTAMQRAEDEGRIAAVKHDSKLRVVTAWDLGIGDSTAIWIAQMVGAEIHAIDYIQNSGVGLEWYVNMLRERPYDYAEHILPHDAEAHELGTGVSRVETLAKLGVRNVRVLPRQSVADGINAGRLLIGRAWFDADKCARGIEALRMYRREWDEKRKVFHDRPMHDWASHCLVGDTEVLTRHGTQRIMDLPPTGEVLTPCGWTPYRNPRITRRAAPLVAVAFSDGLTVKCTPEHLFLTDSGWKSAASLTPGMLIQSCLTKSRSISMAVCIVSGRARGISRAAARAYTALHGALRSVLSRADATFITAMEIPATIGSPISNVCLRESIFPSHGRPTGLAAQSISHKARAMRLLRGTARMLGGSGTAATQNVKRRGQSGVARTNRATTVSACSPVWSATADIRSGSVPRFARPLRIESVTELIERADVWCITVPEGEWYALANGAVSHNSADAWRYLALGRPTGTTSVQMTQQWKWPEPAAMRSLSGNGVRIRRFV